MCTNGSQSSYFQSCLIHFKCSEIIICYTTNRLLQNAKTKFHDFPEAESDLGNRINCVEMTMMMKTNCSCVLLTTLLQLAAATTMQGPIRTLFSTSDEILSVSSTPWVSPRFFINSAVASTWYSSKYTSGFLPVSFHNFGSFNGALR